MSYVPAPDGVRKEGTIHELLTDIVEKHEYLFFTSFSGAKEREQLSSLASELLGCSEERKRESIATLLISTALRPHVKGHEVAAAGNVLNAAELFGIHAIADNQKHFVHQVYTFLVGLLLYHLVPQLRAQLDEEMKRTTSTFSSGTPFGEFLFRWRLSSLAHDLGNAVSLFWGNEEEIDRQLRHLETGCHVSWFPPSPARASVESLAELQDRPRRRNTFAEFGRVSGHDHIKEFAIRLKENPYKGILYDHGVVGSLLLARIIHDLYKRYGWNTLTWDDHQVSFKPVFFDESVVRAARAVAEHNLDFYPDDYLQPWGGSKLYSVRQNALSFLLKVADWLQEWNKPKARDESEYIPPDQVCIRIDGSSVVVLEHPKKDELADKLDRFAETDGVIRV